jgi:hypothetical protein
MTRREGLAALLLMFCLLATGLAWQFGPLGLICAAILGTAAILFCFQRVERVERSRAEPVPDDVPELFAALGRDRP